MAMLELPVRSDFKSYKFQSDLDGKTYTLKFRLNERMDLWIMGIADVEGVDLLTGIPLQTNVDLIPSNTNPLLPPGSFICFDSTGKARNAGSDDLGNDIKLLYQEANGDS